MQEPTHLHPRPRPQHEFIRRSGLSQLGGACSRARDDGKVLDMENIVGMAEARPSRGKKLKNVKIVVRGDGPDPEDVLELRKHVRHAEYGPRVGAIGDNWR